VKRLGILIAFCTVLLFGSLINILAQTDNNGYNLKKVVIDAGHGGKDPGCLGSGSREKHIALSIALKLGNYIKTNLPEVEVIYTRNTDVFIELHERANIANKSKADLFISIHCNANTSKQPYGTETYVMGLHKTEENLDVSKRENSAILFEDNYSTHYDGFDPNSPEGHILFALNQSAYLKQSIILASKIQTQFKDRAKRRSRGVYQAGFLVLYKTVMPAVLIETGFLSNWSEEQYLKTDAGQSHIASAIFRAFRDYKEEMEGTPTIEKEDTVVDVIEVKEVIEETKPPDIVSDHEVTQSKVGDPVSATPIEKDVAVERPSSIRFRVQILTADKPVDLKSSKFSTIVDLESAKFPNGLIKYMVGSYPSLQEAIERQYEMRKSGFEGAFIVAYKGEERISVKEALSLIK